MPAHQQSRGQHDCLSESLCQHPGIGTPTGVVKTRKTSISRALVNAAICDMDPVQFNFYLRTTVPLQNWTCRRSSVSIISPTQMSTRPSCTSLAQRVKSESDPSADILWRLQGVSCTGDNKGRILAEVPKSWPSSSPQPGRIQHSVRRVLSVHVSADRPNVVELVPLHQCLR